MTRFPTLRRLWRSLVTLVLVGRSGCRWCSLHRRVGSRHWCQIPGRSAREIPISTYRAGKDPEWCPHHITQARVRAAKETP